MASHLKRVKYRLFDPVLSANWRSSAKRNLTYKCRNVAGPRNNVVLRNNRHSFFLLQKRISPCVSSVPGALETMSAAPFTTQSPQSPDPYRLPPPRQIHPAIKAARWVALGMGIGWGITRQTQLKKYEAVLREERHQREMLEKARKERESDAQSYDTKPAFLTTTKRRPSRLLPTSKRHGPHSDETSSDASEISLKHSRSDDDDSRSPSPKRKCKKSKTFRSPSPPPPETVSATKLRGKHRSQNRPQRKTPRIEDCVSVDPTDWKDFLIIVLKAFGFSPLERLLDYKGLSQVSADEIALQEMQLGTELSTDNIYIIRDRDGQKRKEKLTDFFNEIKNSPMNFVPVPNAGGDSPRICMIQMFGGDCGDDGITCPEQDSSPQTNGSFFGCLFGNFGGGNGCNGSNGCKCNGSSGGCNGGGCSGYSSGGCSGAAGGFFSGGSSGCGSAGCGSSSTYSYTPCRRCGNNLTKCTCFSTVKLLSEKGALGRTTPAQLIDPVLPSTKRPSDGSETKESFILQDAAGTGQMLAAATASPPNPQGSSTGSALGVTVVNDVTDVSNTIENETNTDHNLRTTALSVTMKEKQAQQLSPKLVAAKKGEEKHPFCKEWTPTSCEEEGKAKKGGGGSGGDGSGGAGKQGCPVYSACVGPAESGTSGMICQIPVYYYPLGSSVGKRCYHCQVIYANPPCKSN